MTTLGMTTLGMVVLGMTLRMVVRGGDPADDARMTTPGMVVRGMVARGATIGVRIATRVTTCGG